MTAPDPVVEALERAIAIERARLATPIVGDRDVTYLAELKAALPIAVAHAELETAVRLLGEWVNERERDAAEGAIGAALRAIGEA